MQNLQPIKLNFVRFRLYVPVKWFKSEQVSLVGKVILTLQIIFFNQFRHALSQDTNKLAKETKDTFKRISEYTRGGRFEHLDHRQV